MNTKKIMIAFLLVAGSFSACKKDEQESVLTKPTAENIEIGTGNNKSALIGRDFHFNADVVAATKIKDVEVKILQKATERYTSTWSLERTWPEYIGVKNTNVHKHFSIPTDAPEGKYDFYFIVTDENGSQLKIKEDFTITDPANMPVKSIKYQLLNEKL